MTRARDVANIDGLLTTTGDTYYASAAATPARLGIGTTGQVLSVSGGVPTWATPAMTLISTTSFTNQASQAFDGVFTSTYKTYLLIFESIRGSSANQTIRMQMRTSGPTTVATTYYNGHVSPDPNGSVYSVGQSNTTFAQISGTFDTTATNSISGQLYVFGCSGSSASVKVTYQLASVYTGASYNGGFVIGDSRIYTGFILTSSSGNLTGTVSIYGVA
jgi:hypothetical protein